MWHIVPISFTIYLNVKNKIKIKKKQENYNLSSVILSFVNNTWKKICRTSYFTHKTNIIISRLRGRKFKNHKNDEP